MFLMTPGAMQVIYPGNYIVKHYRSQQLRTEFWILSENRQTPCFAPSKKHISGSMCFLWCIWCLPCIMHVAVTQPSWLFWHRYRHICAPRGAMKLQIHRLRQSEGERKSHYVELESLHVSETQEEDGNWKIICPELRCRVNDPMPRWEGGKNLICCSSSRVSH